MLDRRELAGFALAPLPIVGPSILFPALFLLSWPSDASALLGIMIGILFFGYAATLMVGLPVHLVLRWQRRRELVAYLLATIVAIYLLVVLLALFEPLLLPAPLAEDPFRPSMWNSVSVVISLIFSLAACISASVFWAVAVRRRSRNG